jgi:hypothetical protein
VTSGSIASVVDNDNPLYIGRFLDNGESWNGNIDEVRLSSGARSAEWIATEFANQNSPAQFCIVDDEEPASTTFYQRDLYHITDHTSQTENIDKVTVFFRFSGDATGTGYAKAAIKTHGTVYTGSEQSQADQSFTTGSYEWANNPYTGSAWTWAEIDALQAGIELKGAVGVSAYCTQIYVAVDYEAPTTEAARYLTKTSDINLTIWAYGGNGFPLVFSWIKWSGSGGTEYDATYAITGGTLKRSEVVDGGAPVQTLIAQNIDAPNTSCTFNNGELTLTITTVVGSGQAQVTEAREYKVIKRPD